MTTKQLLRSFRFANNPAGLCGDMLYARWANLPGAILIHGPAASGKTRLAKIIAESNLLTPRFLISPSDHVFHEKAFFPTGMCVVYDNVKKIPPLQRLFRQRQLGTREHRVALWSGLYIVTTGDSSLVSGNEHFFDAIIELLPPNEKPRQRRSPSKSPVR